MAEYYYADPTTKEFLFKSDHAVPRSRETAQRLLSADHEVARVRDQRSLRVHDHTTRAIIELINLIVITLIMLHGIKQKSVL